MPNPYMFVYRISAVPQDHIHGFPKKMRRFDVTAKISGTSLDGLTPKFNNNFSDVNRPFSTDRSVLSKNRWRTKINVPTWHQKAASQNGKRRLFTRCYCAVFHFYKRIGSRFIRWLSGHFHSSDLKRKSLYD